jgi:hypothetical protein
MPHARRATPCSSEARVGSDRHPPGHLRLLHNPADDGSGVPAHRPRPLRRGCRPGPRRLLAPGRPDRSRRGTGRVLPRRPQHPGGKLGERSEGRRHRTARHAPDDERRRYRAHQGRGGAGVGPGARLRRHAASLQAGERRQPTPPLAAKSVPRRSSTPSPWRRRTATVPSASLSTGGRWRWPAAVAARTWSVRRGYSSCGTGAFPSPFSLE